MSQFALKTVLPPYLRVEKERAEAAAHAAGLDFFPVVFEMITYDQMNEIAAYGGFPVRYPHWRFGMEYGELSKTYEYGFTKIYEMVINNYPAYAYLLEGNSLTEQRLVMAHVLAHVDFFKNNFCFRATDLDAAGRVIDPSRREADYRPNRRWIDKMANHGSVIGRHMARFGVDAVEMFTDHCLSLDNLIDAWAPFRGHPARPVRDDDETPPAMEVPKLAAKEYMDRFINPPEYLAEQREKMRHEAEEKRQRVPAEPERDVLKFLLQHAPLERWERDVLTVVRDEAYYFVPQMQTKIMNEGWASYWHSRLLTEGLLDTAGLIDYAESNAGVMSTAGGRLNPYKLGVQLYRHIEERWDKGQFGREWELCESSDHKRVWDMKLGRGREKLFQVRALYNDVTFIDEFLTPEFVAAEKLYTFGYSSRNGRFEIETRKFDAIKSKLLFQLTNFGHPTIVVYDANFQNRGELLLRHEHRGLDLDRGYAKATLAALARVWKRPVAVATIAEGKPVLLRHDGSRQTEEPYAA